MKVAVIVLFCLKIQHLWKQSTKFQHYILVFVVISWFETKQKFNFRWVFWYDFKIDLITLCSTPNQNLINLIRWLASLIPFFLLQMTVNSFFGILYIIWSYFTACTMMALKFRIAWIKKNLRDTPFFGQLNN